MAPPRRQVQRVGARPSYSRQRRAKEPWRPKVPAPLANTSWLRVTATGTVVLIILVLLAKATAVTTVQVTGERSLTSAHVTQLTNNGLHHQLFGRNLILMNSGGLESYLTSTEPGIKQVSVSRHLFHTVKVSISERQPSLNWKTGGITYLLDSDGTVISPTLGVYAKLPVVTDGSNLPVKKGDRVAPRSFVTFCLALAGALPPAGYQISAMTVPTSTSEVNVQTDKGLLLKFDTTRPAGEEITDLQQVQKQLTATKKTPAEYIDLRIEHKAYFK